VSVALVLGASAAPSCGFSTRDFGGTPPAGDVIAPVDQDATTDAEHVPPADDVAEDTMEEAP